MVNKINKGNRAEREARTLLQQQGYLVEKKNTSRWESNDFWGLFDVLALKPDGSEIRLVQVKTNKSDFYKARKHINQWVSTTGISGVVRCEVWLKEPRAGWITDTCMG